MLYPWRSTRVRLAAAAAGALAAAIVAVTVIAAPAVAYIALHDPSAASGSTVTGSGGGFSPVGSAVQLHLDRSSSSTLWSGTPDRGGAVTFNFTVPAVAPGSHTVVATQTGRDGDPVAGTPATAPLQITAPSAPSPTASQAGQPQAGQGIQQKQPAASPPRGQPPLPGASSVTSVPSAAGTPATVAPPAAAPPVVFSLPRPDATRLTSPPPQVATLWRVGGAVPTLAAPVIAPAAPAPATSAGSRGALSVPTLVALAVLIASAIVLIATTLQVRSGEAHAPEAAPAAPQRQRAPRRSATMRSPDLWSGSPAHLR